MGWVWVYFYQIHVTLTIVIATQNEAIKVSGKINNVQKKT